MADERKRIWICGACGRSSHDRMNVGDVSCYLNAVECFEDTIVRNNIGRIVAAKAIDDPTPWTDEELGRLKSQA